MIMMFVGSSTVAKIPLQEGMLITGEIMHVYGGEYMGNLCTFQFSCEPETSLKNKILTWKEGRREGRRQGSGWGFLLPLLFLL